MGALRREIWPEKAAVAHALIAIRHTGPENPSHGRVRKTKRVKPGYASGGCLLVVTVRFGTDWLSAQSDRTTRNVHVQFRWSPISRFDRCAASVELALNLGQMHSLIRLSQVDGCFSSSPIRLLIRVADDVEHLPHSARIPLAVYARQITQIGNETAELELMCFLL